MKKQLVIDGNNLSHRVRHTMRELRTADGQNTAVIYGMVSCILSFCSDTSYQDIVLCWDWGQSQRRLALYPEYKAQRREKRAQASDIEQEEFSDFYAQIDIAKKMLACLGIRNAAVYGMDKQTTILFISSRPIRTWSS